MGILQIAIVILVLVLLVKPLGTYLYQVFRYESNGTDRWFSWAEKRIFALIGLKERKGMTWKGYAVSFVLTNIVLVAAGYLILRLQESAAVEPERYRPYGTNLVVQYDYQLYDQYESSALQRRVGIVLSGPDGRHYDDDVYVRSDRAVRGDCFYPGGDQQGHDRRQLFEDFVKAHTRVFIPAAFIIAMVLVALQVPQTLKPTLSVTTLEGSEQQIAVGPVAALESIKHLGTNGGGFMGANSAHPFENPSPLTNVIEILSMWSLGAALPYTFGLFAKSRKQGWIIFSVMMTLFIGFLSLNYAAETNGNPALNQLGIDASQGSMEGKEVRFGIAQSSLFTTVTTAATTGSVNNMHDTLTPLGGITPLSLMMLNSVFGGKGVGLMNMLMYAILAVFLAGLMVGRTPNFSAEKSRPGR